MDELTVREDEAEEMRQSGVRKVVVKEGKSS